MGIVLKFPFRSAGAIEVIEQPRGRRQVLVNEHDVDTPTFRRRDLALAYANGLRAGTGWLLIDWELAGGRGQ